MFKDGKLSKRRCVAAGGIYAKYANNPKKLAKCVDEICNKKGGLNIQTKLIKAVNAGIPVWVVGKGKNRKLKYGRKKSISKSKLIFRQPVKTLI